jgi:hypothetical protein
MSLLTQPRDIEKLRHFALPRAPPSFTLLPFQVVLIKLPASTVAVL